MSRQPIGLHAPTHLPDGSDPIEAELLTLTDGSLTIPDVTELFVGAGLKLTDLGGGEGKIQIPDYQTYTPVVTASSVNPTLGGGSSVVGYYVEINKLVHCFGSVAIGTSPSIGTGNWFITLPVPESQLNLMGQAIIFSPGTGSNQILNMNVEIGPEQGGTSSQFLMVYPATWPIGSRVLFGSASAWSLAALDALYWNFVYRAA
jgi:hypothetical protein